MTTQTVEELYIEQDEPPGSSKDEWTSWKWQLKERVDKAEKLNRFFLFSDSEKVSLAKAVERYPMSITPYYLSLIDRDNPADPIRMQSLPSSEELAMYPYLYEDPLGEENDTVLPGLVHRYPDRVLVTLTNMCPVNCRHCTRKREWHKGNWVRTSEEFEDICQYISAHEKIRDVILSGGDPFILSTQKIESVLKRLRTISHVEIIRIGTRCPVVLPQRIDNVLVSVLKKYRPLWVNTHFNHPNEITKESSRACDMILCAGIPVNNQSVLLKGINDNAQIMTRLCQKLLAIGVRPYYLFQCDPVEGTGHLRTSIESGLEIIKAMRGFTSGLAIPNFVVDGLEGQGKVPLQPDYLISLKNGCAVLKSYKDEIFNYYSPSGIG